MIPTVRSAILAAAGLAVAVLPVVLDARLWAAWAACGLLLVAAMLADAALLPRKSSIALDVAAPASLMIGEPGTVSVEMSARGGSTRAGASALAEIDGVFARQPEQPMTARGGVFRTTVPLVPVRRGAGRLSAVWLRLRGPLGLVEKRIRRPLDRTVAVLPDVRPVRAAALHAANRREPAFGTRTMRFVGEGSDFAALRDFVPGDDPRAMSWRASARHRRLLAREFLPERDQSVVLAFDTGHLMSEPLDGMPRLDHGINAGLLLAWSCLKSSDKVGLYAFAARPGPFRPPAAGMRTFADLRTWVGGLSYGTDETNYTLALSHLSEKLRRRSLVVLMTDFVDVVAARLMIQNVGKLVERHLVLFVTPADPAPRRLAAASPDSMPDVHRAVVAAQFLRERESVLSRLRRLGAHCIDAEPAELQQGVVERYLWIKRRGLI